MNWLGQHWYTYIFTSLIVTTIIAAGVNANKNNPSKTVWFIFVCCIWSMLTYYTWTI